MRAKNHKKWGYFRTRYSELTMSLLQNPHKSMINLERWVLSFSGNKCSFQNFFFFFKKGAAMRISIDHLDLSIKSVFDSVVAGAFQIAFRAEMHANDVFLFFKNHF